MEERTRIALEASIQHWETNVERARKGQEPDVSVGACALCNLHYRLSCRGCPVYEDTGRPLCEDTPYNDVVRFISRPLKECVLPACEKELAFLRSLHPDCKAAVWAITRSGITPLYWGYVRVNGKLTGQMAWTTAVDSARRYSSRKNAKNALAQIRRYHDILSEWNVTVTKVNS